MSMSDKNFNKVCSPKLTLSCRRQGAAFSLVELLVVISIIVLLLSLLMPALRNARRGAEAAGCYSNLKQITAAALMFSADHNGMIVRPRPNGASTFYGSSSVWPNELASYLGMKRVKQSEADGDPVVQSVVTCPTQFRLKPQYTTYGQNGRHDGFGLRGVDPSKARKSQKRITMAVVLGPSAGGVDRWPISASTLPYFMDGSPHGSSNANGLWQLWRLAYHEGSCYERTFPHNGACQMSFFDGSVRKTYTEQEMWKGGWDSKYAMKYASGYKIGESRAAF